MKTLAEIRAVKQGVEAALLKRKGVTGIDVGYKRVKGKKTDQLAIRVMVEKKGKVAAKDMIPQDFDGVVSDVIERKFVLHPRRMSVADLEKKVDDGRYDPLQGGISIGPCRSIGGYIYVGTLGVMVEDNNTGDPMMLSNFHVMCVDDGWSVGDTMAQPGRPDGGSCPADVVGTLERAVLGDEVDCAVATLDTDRDHQCSIVEIGDVAGTANAVLDEAVRKRGRTTELTYGTVDSIDLTVTIDYEDGLGNVTLTNQIGIDADTSQNAAFGISGDSGSVVVNEDNRVIGLYFAGTSSGDFGVANPIASVLSALDVRLCRVKRIEKLPKLEQKELKLERLEKDFSKEIKDRIKEYKELKEFKEFKEKDIKEFKEKDIKEFKEFGEKDPKEKDKEKDIYEGGWFDPGRPYHGAAPASGLEQRMAGLEAAVQQLTHFIHSGLRPDLSQGALKQERDLGCQGGGTHTLHQQAQAAKQAKDNKDVEKLSER